MTDAIDTSEALTAFEHRDRAYDGRFVVAVRTTRIYCKPSCPARHPKPGNVTLYSTPHEARAAGYRACLRCKPDEVGRDRVAVADAVAALEASEGIMPLSALAAQVGYAPHHFHRLFKRATGVTPAEYGRALRARGVEAALATEPSVTSAIYASGYSGSSRFYADGARRLGMTPSAWRNGGAGVTIRWTVTDTSLGRLLIAATGRGLCRVAFDETELDLARRFPQAGIVSGGAAFANLAARVVKQVESPARDHDLPLDVRGTAFQEAVWQALQRIPAGRTRSYAELAAAIDRPTAVRAVGAACGANPVAIVIPCHRVTRGDGALGGYAYGPERKARLIERER